MMPGTFRSGLLGDLTGGLGGAWIFKLCHLNTAEASSIPIGMTKLSFTFPLLCGVEKVAVEGTNHWAR